MNRPVIIALILITASLIGIWFMGRNTFYRMFPVTGGETINNLNNQ